MPPSGSPSFQRLAREQRMTILLCSHQLHQVQKICDRSGIMIKSRLIADGPIDQLARAARIAHKLYSDAKAIVIDPLRQSTRSSLAIGPLEAIFTTRSSGYPRPSSSAPWW